MSLAFAPGCASNSAPGPGTPTDGGMDGAADAGADGMTGDAGTDTGTDAGPEDAGTDSGPEDAGTDAGPGEGGTCAACESDADCQAEHYCAELMSGGSACLPRCNPDLPDCPPRFSCVEDYSGSIDVPVCAPVGERCCVDADEDLHGTGVGCLGSDCDDDDMSVNESAMESCDGVDNDCSGTADDGDPATMCPPGDHVADTSCGGGSCQIEGCEPGFADCDGDPTNGCETSTGTVTDCGMCGEPCEPPNATGDCSSGACRVGTCDDGWANCDGAHDNGCETPLDTLTDCGACGDTCDLAHATETCATGSCEIDSCDTNWGDCDSLDNTGCETSLTTNSDCGGCGDVCSPSHGTGDCSTGSCELASCDSGWGDCNFDGSSCETSLRTNSNCGGCGDVCSILNANESCSTGSCTFQSCQTDTSSCDGDTSDGCEVEHDSYGGSCGGGVNAGTRDGDVTCGGCCVGTCCCDNSDWNLFHSSSGRTSQWFKARVNEGSSCVWGGDLEHRIRLDVPSGVDYDLYVYKNCGASPVDSSRGGAGSDETVTVGTGDSSGSDDSFDYYVEVRHYGGESCAEWTIRFEGHDC